MEPETAIREVVEQQGLELVEVSFARAQGRRVLQVVVERPEGGLDLDTIAQASERISRRLDLDGYDPGPYALEVGSPGLERPLRSPRDFARHVGRRARVRTVAREGGAADTLEGTIVAADDRGMVLSTEAGERRVAYGDVAKARSLFDWSDTKRASNA